MIYLTGVAGPALRPHLAEHPRIGFMLEPRSSLFTLTAGRPAAYDNGAFGAWRTGRPFDEAGWRRGLGRCPPGLLFAVVPDAVGEHDATRALWDRHVGAVRAAGQCAAFVLQNGCADLAQVPDDADAVFIGGDDAYKLGPHAARVAWQARADGRWVHMGRVNSSRRWRRALAVGCDSADGTFLRFGPPELMVARVAQWIEDGDRSGGQTDLLDMPEVGTSWARP